MNYMDHYYNGVVQRNPNEAEFHQAVQEVLASIGPVLERRPDLRKAKIVERIVALLLAAKGQGDSFRLFGYSLYIISKIRSQCI